MKVIKTGNTMFTIELEKQEALKLSIFSQLTGRSSSQLLCRMLEASCKLYRCILDDMLPTAFTE